jgi:hypothetical protein
VSLKLSLSLLVALSLVGCKFVPNGSSMSRLDALRLSDSFMSDLIDDRVDQAVDKMEREFVKSVENAQAEASIDNLFSYCGRPLEKELRHEDIGTFFYPDGRMAPLRTFYYSGKTTQYPKGVCFFSVKIVPGAGEMRVSTFGPLKLVSGQLPDWAR